MKILHLSSENVWRGGEQHIAYLTEELLKLQIESVVAVRRDSAFHKYCIKKNIPHRSLPFTGEWDVQTAFQIKNICQQEKFDLVHCYSAHSHTTAVVASLLGNQTPIIVSRLVDFPIHKNIFSRFKYNHRRVKRILCASEVIRTIVSRELTHPEKCEVVYLGIDLEKFTSPDKNYLRKAMNISAHKPVIGNIAALVPHKDYFTFLETAGLLLKKQPVQFLIIGEGPLEAEIRKKIIALHLEESVQMCGFRDDVEKLLPGLDVLLFTSEQEGLGLAIIEAQQCGVPVVATAVGGIPEIIQNGVNGFLAPEKNAQALADGVSVLLENESLRAKMIEAGKLSVKQFSKEKTVEKILSIYQEVLSAEKKN